LPCEFEASDLIWKRRRRMPEPLLTVKESADYLRLTTGLSTCNDTAARNPGCLGSVSVRGSSTEHRTSIASSTNGSPITSPRKADEARNRPPPRTAT
jgi:hypothetical protein